MKAFFTTVAAAMALFVGGAATARAQISDNVVKIGVLADTSSIYADVSGMGSVMAARMAVEDAGGRVLGRPVELVFADHQNKPDVGSAIANRWIDVEHVDAIADATTSAIALAMQEIGRAKNRVLLMSSPVASDLTGKACSPVGIHWTYDSYALAVGTARALLQDGGDTWFFLTVDYAVGHALERDATAVIEAGRGKVLGGVRFPLATPDFSSFLLQAQASGAKVIGLASGSGDTANAVKQANEFGMMGGRQRIGALIMNIQDVHSLGLDLAQGLYFTDSFYWDRTEETRAWSKRFFERMKQMPSQVHAGVYSAVRHYLKAVQAAGTDEAKAVVARMRATPVNDMYTTNGRIREDGRMIHDFYLFQVKRPEESTYPWDYYKLVRTIPGEQAARPLAESECPMVKR